MKRSFLLGVALLGTTAFGQSVTADANFVAAASASNWAEITSSKLARQKSRNAFVRDYAESMIYMHTQAQEMLRKAAAQSGIAVPERMMPMQIAAIRRMERLNGPAFDRAYLDFQMKGHLDTLKKVRGYLGRGSNEPLLAHARAQEPAIMHHIMMLKERRVFKMPRMLD